MSNPYDYLPGRDLRNPVVILKPGKAKEQMIEIADFLIKYQKEIEFDIYTAEISPFETFSAMNAYKKYIEEFLESCA